VTGVQTCALPISAGFPGAVHATVEVLEFWDHDEPFRPVLPEIPVEHGQPVRIAFDCPLPFRADDEFQLAVGGRSLAARGVRPSGAGVQVWFEVPFDRLADAAGLAEMPAREFEAGHARLLETVV